jgi:hypothetical protein
MHKRKGTDQDDRFRCIIQNYESYIVEQENTLTDVNINTVERRKS